MADYQLPRDVTRAGPQRSWVAGKVVSVRVRDLDNPEASQNTQASQATYGAGKTKGKGKKSKAKQASRTVLEFYLCGGNTPADVILCEAWEASVRSMLGPLIQVGASMRVRKCLALAFTAKTSGFHHLAPAFLLEDHAGVRCGSPQ